MKGQALIEVLLGLMVGIMVLSAISVSTLSSLKNARFSVSQNRASQLAQEGLEIVRRIRNADSAGFRAKNNGTYCLNDQRDDLITPSSSCEEVDASDLVIRRIIIAGGATCNTPSLDEVKSQVSWKDSTCTGNQYCQVITFTTCL